MHLSSPEIDQRQRDGIFSIDFVLPGAQPPVYIAGTFTDPKWKLIKMKYVELVDSEYKFWVELELSKDQEFQYKFRMGEKNWVLNEDEPTVIDTAGNRNNVLPANSNINEWSEMPRTDRSEDVWEERRLTKYVTEKRKKDFGIPLVEFTKSPWSHMAQSIPDLDSTAADTSGEEKQINEKYQHSELQDKGSIKSLELHTKRFPIITDPLIPESTLEPPPTPAVDVNRSHKATEIPTQKPNLHKTLPTVGIAKIDAQRSDHENVEIDLTHDLKPLNTVKPEQDITRDQSSILDIANTAAEATDVAAIVDQEPPIPPISDEEAGRVGLRCLSATPIPQVAEVAAEVADTAAELDKDSVCDGVYGNGHELGRITPPNEQVPRFSYEAPLLPVQSQFHPDHFDTLNELMPQIEDEQVPGNIDLNDPSIQYFPTEPAKILAKLVEIQQRLPEDEAHFEEAQLSPAALSDYWGPPSQIERSTSIPSNQQPLSSLKSITEEDNQNSDKSAEGGKKNSSFKNNASELKSQEKEQSKNLENKVKESTGKLQIPESISLEGIKSKVDANSPDTSVSSIKMKTLTQPLDNGAEEKSQIGNEGSLYGTTGSNKYQTQANPVNVAGFDSCASKHKLSVSPTAVHHHVDGGNDEIGIEDEPMEVEDAQASLLSSSSAVVEDRPDVSPPMNPDPNGKARSTGIANDTTQEPILRRSTNQKITQQRLKSPDRPLRKSKLSSENDIQRRGFVKAFFQIVIVDWIGGLIRTLFSGFKSHT